jgi:hypothetical protein
VAPKAAYLAAGHSSQEVNSALGTLPGLHEEQEEEPVDVVIFPSAQSRHSPTPPTEYRPRGHSRQSLVEAATA